MKYLFEEGNIQERYWLYECLKSLTEKESVHLENWPQICSEFYDKDLLDEIDMVQDIIHLARGIRNKHNIKNRQPLSLLEVAFANKENAKLATIP